MIKALAPILSRECPGVWLSIVLASCLTTSPPVLAQATKAGPTTKPVDSKNAPAPKATPKAAGAAAPATAEPDEEESPAKRGGMFEVYKDPRAEQAIGQFKSIPGLPARPPRPQDVSAVRAMSAGQAVLDAELLRRYVLAEASELIDKRNITALISPPPGPATAASRAIQTATDNLIDPLLAARQAKNDEFLKEYNRLLVATLPKLLDNNLIARIEAMIILGQTQSPDAVRIYIDQLKNPNQTIWVALWALRGLSLIVDDGALVDAAIPAQTAMDSAKAVVTFLDREANLPWPVQMRAMETLGAMRQAAMPLALPQAELASAAMRYLGNPDANPHVRARAAAALGFMRVNAATPKYNFALIAHHAGQLAAQLGDQVQTRLELNPVQVEGWASLLAGPIHQCFYGRPDVRESGLLKNPIRAGHPGPTPRYIETLGELTTAVAKAAVDLIRSPGSHRDLAHKDLGLRVAALKNYLAKNPLKEWSLVPSGKDYPPRQESHEMAGQSRAQSSGGAGAPGGE
jgi:hypothetical protein